MNPVGDLYQYMLRVNIEGFMYIHCTTGLQTLHLSDAPCCEASVCVPAESLCR